MSEKMPVVFVGHGSATMVLEDNAITTALRELGEEIVHQFGRPKGILAVSAHWYAPGTYVQGSEEPKQVFDLSGVPQKMYELQYPVKGDVALADEVQKLLGSQAVITDGHGIDHGIWSVLRHLFPEADVPVVEMSVDASLSKEQIYHLAKKLAPLREQGYLIIASGNVVHNIREADWENPGGTDATNAFVDVIVDMVNNRDDSALLAYEDLPNAGYAIPTPEHYLPLIYALGASEGEPGRAFNNKADFGSVALTGFVFGMEPPAGSVKMPEDPADASEDAADTAQ